MESRPHRAFPLSSSPPVQPLRDRLPRTIGDDAEPGGIPAARLTRGACPLGSGQSGELEALFVIDGRGLRWLRMEQERPPMPPGEHVGHEPHSSQLLLSRAPEARLAGKDRREVAERDPESIQCLCVGAITCGEQTVRHEQRRHQAT